MKRILHITGGMQRAGAETLLMNLYRNLDRDNYQFDFLYFTNDECDYDQEILERGGRIYRIPPKFKSRYLRILSRYFEYVKLLRRLKDHQVIHSHINLNGAFFLWLAKINGKKIRISHSHISKGKNALIPNAYRWLTRRVIKNSANLYMACGKAAGSYLYPSISEDKIIVFPNAINIDEFQGFSTTKDKLRKELNLDKETKIITQIGRFTFQKNFEFTINFVEHLVNKKRNVHFVFLGTGPLEKKLKSMVGSKNLSSFITFYGVSNEIPAILHDSDVFFMPSNLEGFPVVLVEAQACGIPCVISTNISPEVDMGLNLVKFIDLEEDNNIWENSLLKSFEKKSRDFQKIKKVMGDKNFDAASSVKKLQDLYAKSLVNG